MLGRGVAAELARRRPEELWEPALREVAAGLDLVLCNLECCLSERGSPTDRVPDKPFFFRGPPAAVDALRAMGVRAAGVANNHALDFGPQALGDTLALLDGAGIAAAGAGREQAAARRAAFVSAGKARVGLVSFTDHPREYAADGEAPGVAFAELRRGLPDWLLEELSAARERCDLLVAFPHWGHNMATQPAEWQQRAAAELQDAGADLVAGHSAHLVHGVGWTARGPVLYDLGDALDDYKIDPALRNDLGVLAVWRPGDGGDELELIGLRLEYTYTRLATGADAEWIARRLERACAAQGTQVERAGEQTFRVHAG